VNKAGTQKVRSVYRACLLTTVLKELSKYELDLVRVQEVRWGRGDIKPEGKYTFLYGNRNRINTCSMTGEEEE
jgi:hypothetical protein